MKLSEVIYLVIKFTKENLIKNIAKQTKIDVSDVKDVYNALESVIFNILSSVDENQNVSIRLFEGISLDGIYVPEKIKRNNLTGKMSFIKSKIKPNFYITRSYCEKLNNQ